MGANKGISLGQSGLTDRQGDWKGETLVPQIDDRINHARQLLQVARNEFAAAGEAKGREAVIGLRNACGKGWLAALEATNCFFFIQGVAESELPENDRGRKYFVGMYMDRNMRRAYIDMRQTFHIEGYSEGMLDFDDMPRHFGELEEYINDIQSAGHNGSRQ